MNKFRIPVYFGSLHGLNDCIAGVLLANYSLNNAHTQEVVLAYLGYGLLAFGGQLPVGWLLDIYQRPKPLIKFSIFLLLASCITAPYSMPTAIILAGMASALVHVSGGTVCFLQDTSSTASSGIFTAPGVLGLILGGIAGHAGSVMILYCALPILVLLLFIFPKLALPGYEVLNERKNQPVLEAHDYMMLVLLLAIAMRSMIWNMLHMLAEQRDIKWLLGIALAAFAGKLIGGFITEKADWKKYVFISMIAAALLLSFGKERFPLFCAGIFLLQSVVPVTLWMMQQYLKKQPAAATALSLGVAIIIAGLPSYLSEFRSMQQDNNLFTAIFVLLMILNVYWVIKTQRRPT